MRGGKGARGRSAGVRSTVNRDGLAIWLSEERTLKMSDECNADCLSSDSWHCFELFDIRQGRSKCALR